MKKIKITVDGILLTVGFELKTPKHEPNNLGGELGNRTEIRIKSVCVGGIDISDILSDEKIEEIAVEVLENLE